MGEFDLIQVMISAMAFGNVVSKGNCSTPDLTCEAEFFKVRKSSTHIVHGFSELSGELVRFQIFECPERLWISHTVETSTLRRCNLSPFNLFNHSRYPISSMICFSSGRISGIGSRRNAIVPSGCLRTVMFTLANAPSLFG